MNNRHFPLFYVDYYDNIAAVDFYNPLQSYNSRSTVFISLIEYSRFKLPMFLQVEKSSLFYASQSYNPQTAS